MEEFGKDKRKNYVSHYQNNIQRQRQLAEMWDRGSLLICGEMKSSCGRVLFTSCCTVKERSGIKWVELGI
jgi:hypothetical protein